MKSKNNSDTPLIDFSSLGKTIMIGASIALVFIFFSCKDTVEESPKKTFDKELWNGKDVEDNYSYRDDMLNDLVYNVKLKGLNKQEVTAMLGEADRTNEDYLYYEILSKEVGIFPLHKKFLVLKFDKNNTVEWRKIKD